MRITGSRAYYRPTPPRMPPGVVELIEGLTKEVLKHNPADVYAFCAGHMQHLLQIRDGPFQKKTLSLDEKISRAQNKIRKRAEIRRQEYDKNILQQQQSQMETNEELYSNNKEVTQFHSEKYAASNALKMPVHHENELENSSEIELCLDHSANEIIKADPQNEDEKMHEVVHSDEIEPSTVNETKNGENISMNENIIEPIGQPAEITIGMNDALGNISQEGNMNNEGSINDEEQKISENNTDKQSNIIEDALEQIPKINKVEPNVEVHEKINMGIDEKQISETNIDKQCLPALPENYINENITDATNTDIIQFTGGCNELSIKDKAELEIEATVVDTGDCMQHDSNLINNVKDSSIIELNNDNDVSCNKTKDAYLLNEIDNNNPLKLVDKVEKSELSDNSKLIAATENKVDVIDLGIPQATQSECVTKDPALAIGDSIKHLDVNEDENETLIGDDISAVEAPVANEEKKKVNISIPGDEEITVHNGLTQGNLNELYMKSSSVTNTDLEDASKNIDNLSTKLDDNTHTALTNSVNADIESIAPHANANTENDNNISTVDIETAAITIQKVFRSFLFKSRASTFDDTGNDEENFLEEKDTDTKGENGFPIPSTINLERRPHGITRMDTVLQTVNEEKSLSLSTDDSSTLSSAATIIQAHVRGFLVRNKLNSNKTLSTNSFPASNSNDLSLNSLDNDIDQLKNKTVLNIHIVPEGGNFLSRDESLITSTELSLDGSPPSSINLHPLGYDKSERRKQLKREDAIQSVSPPSNNSGKLSEEVDSVREILIEDNNAAVEQKILKHGTSRNEVDEEPPIAREMVATAPAQTAVASPDVESNNHVNTETAGKERIQSMSKMSSDEMDVVTPFISSEDKNSSDSKLMHSGEFHDLVLPTRVSRSDTTVVRGE